jgi:hypothetical protein
MRKRDRVFLSHRRLLVLDHARMLQRLSSQSAFRDGFADSESCEGELFFGVKALTLKDKRQGAMVSPNASGNYSPCSCSQHATIVMIVMVRK